MPRLQGEHPSVCAAIEDHWKPQGPADRVPSDPVAIAVALADKLDTLVGFWAIDEKPTGSKDPYALRRAALGMTRSYWSGTLDLSLRGLIEIAFHSLIISAWRRGEIFAIENDEFVAYPFEVFEPDGGLLDVARTRSRSNQLLHHRRNCTDNS